MAILDLKLFHANDLGVVKTILLALHLKSSN